MNYSLTYRFFFVLVIAISSTFAQNTTTKGYSIDGDDIVFTFHRDDYQVYSDDAFGGRIPFDELDVNNVVVSGEFNDWSKYRWKMEKIDKNTYQLRKPISSFNDAFSWEFKFIVNNQYWAEPTNNDINIAQATEEGRPLHVFNLNMFTNAYPSPKGNVRFRLRGYENAENVILAGSFNKWNEGLFKLYKIENGWELLLQMTPGDYQYRFIVDGQWMEDPSNPDRIPNEFGEYNSHINIGKHVTFLLKGHQDAKTVILAGSFNDWNEHELSMQKTESGYWSYRLPLSAGKHHYKFIVDGKWLLDPSNPVKESDGMGHVNSVHMVK